jgi:hypothetical protein
MHISISRRFGVSNRPRHTDASPDWLRNTKLAECAVPVQGATRSPHRTGADTRGRYDKPLLRMAGSARIALVDRLAAERP